MPTIPKCMSTQHPDNVSTPFFAENTELGGEDEIQEAYYAFSHLGCDEQMWDCEGKEVDNYVIKKLLAKYESFFRENRLGEDNFITLRVPNPKIEKAEAKILLETLESIPRSFDAAKTFYGDDTPPILEVILPMTEDAKSIDRIYRYYADFIVGNQSKPIRPGDIKVSEWIGEFKPEKINVIPLFEDMEHMLGAHDTVSEYLEDKDVEAQRVFLARSDPAMNYGIVSAVLFNKVALSRLHAMAEDIDVKIYPIIGVGSAPFRGNLRPQTVDRVCAEYPSVHTFTIQSAFKYDNPPDDVRKAVEKIRGRTASAPPEIDVKRCLDIAKRYSREYQRQVMELAPFINRVSKFVPSRRKRKLHIGLFGYSRSLNGSSLPRAIPFTAALYSVGLPPETLGLTALSDGDLQDVREAYVGFDEDMRDALRYFNPESPYIPKGLAERVKPLLGDVEADSEHKRQTDHVIKALRDEKNGELEECVLRAASIRRFLG